MRNTPLAPATHRETKRTACVEKISTSRASPSGSKHRCINRPNAPMKVQHKVIVRSVLLFYPLPFPPPPPSLPETSQQPVNRRTARRLISRFATPLAHCAPQLPRHLESLPRKQPGRLAYQTHIAPTNNRAHDSKRVSEGTLANLPSPEAAPCSHKHTPQTCAAVSQPLPPLDPPPPVPRDLPTCAPNGHHRFALATILRPGGRPGGKLLGGK